MKKLLFALLLCSASMLAQTTCVNCGGTVYASGGTTSGTIPKSNGSSVLADSSIVETGTNAERVGAAAGATPAAASVVIGESGSGSNIAGAAGTIQPGNGTGTGGSGNLLFQTAPIAGSSSTANTMATTLTVQRGTVADPSGQVLAPGGSGTAPGFSFASQTTTGLVASGGSLYLVTPNVNVNFNNGTSVASTLATGTGLFTAYGGGISVAGQGLTSIRGVTSQKAETTTADASVLALTPPATAGTYRVSVNISVSSATAGVIAWTLSWTDSNGNAQANIAMPLFQLGTAAPNTTFTTSVAGNYTGTSTIDINNAAAAITVKWVGGGTTAAKMSATIERIQ